MSDSFATIGIILIVCGLSYTFLRGMGKLPITDIDEFENKFFKIKGGSGVTLIALGIFLFFWGSYTPQFSPPFAPIPPGITPEIPPGIMPELSVTPDISFNLGAMNAGASASRTFSISNTGGGTLTWNLNADKSWITFNATSGTDSGTVTININTTGLSSGSHSGTIYVTSNGGTKTGYINVQVVKGEPRLSVTPDISFNLGAMNAGASASRTFSISNTGGGTLTWSVSADKSWITFKPTSGTNSGTLTVNINTAGLKSGYYSGKIYVTSNGGTETGYINVQVIKGEPILSVSPDPPSFDLGAMNEGESASRTLSISNTGGVTLTWSLSADKSWITFNPTSGTDSGTVTININTAGLSVFEYYGYRDYSGTIYVTSNGGTKTGRIKVRVVK